MSSEKKYCSNCGAPLVQGASFCINCGTQLEDVVTMPVEEVKTETAPETENEPVLEKMPPELTEPFKTDDVFEYSNVPIPKEKKKGVSVGIVILIAAIAAVIAIAGTLAILKFGGFLTKNNGSNTNNTSGQKENENVVIGGENVSTGDNVVININADSAELAPAVYAKCEKSVVGIRILYEASSMPWQQSTLQTLGEGSGVIYSADGKIITNYHVIEGILDNSGKQHPGSIVRVFLDKSLSDFCDAKILGYDESTDLALLKIERNDLTPIEFADEAKLSVAQRVFTLGSPGGLEFMNSICEGIISGLDRNITTESGFAYDLIQTTAAINPGNSGGALLDSEGKLVGICSMKIASSSFDDMCFAISFKTVENVISNIEQNGKVLRAQLGISVSTEYTEDVAASNNLPAGVWVYAVEEGGAADQAGIKARMIITAIDDKAVTSYASLKTTLAKYDIGAKVIVTAYDKNTGEYNKFTVVLQSSK